MNSMYDILKELTSAMGISGFEEEIRKTIVKAGNFPEHWIDTLGNLYCPRIVDENAPTILLDAHMDEIGFLVRHIDGDGFIFPEPIGSIDPRAIIGSSLIIRGSEDVCGTVSNFPPHIKKDEKVPDIKDLPIDTGLSRQELQEIIKVGDPIVFHSPLKRLSSSKVCSKALDNRAGCAVLCDLSKSLRSDLNIIFLFSSQEEVGARGVVSALGNVRPDLALCLDATHANMHLVKDPMTRELGSGPIIGIGPNIHPKIQKKLVEAAFIENIPYSVKGYPKAIPTNLRSVQIANGGTPSGLLGIPTKYLHTPVEVVDMNDLNATSELLRSFIEGIDKKFIGGLSCY